MQKKIGIGVEREVKQKIERLSSKLRRKINPMKILIYSGELSEDLSVSSYFHHKINFEKFLIKNE